MIKITTIIFAAFWLTLGAVPTFYATMEYAQLKADAKPAQDRKDLADLGFNNIPFYADSPQKYAVIGN